MLLIGKLAGNASLSRFFWVTSKLGGLFHEGQPLKGPLCHAPAARHIILLSPSFPTEHGQQQGANQKHQRLVQYRQPRRAPLQAPSSGAMSQCPLLPSSLTSAQQANCSDPELC